MVLQTISDQPFISPLSRLLDGQRPAGYEQAQHSAGLVDLSGQLLLHIRGVQLPAAMPATIGDVLAIDEGLSTRLRSDICLTIGVPPERIDVGGEALLTITDITHGRGHLLLLGKHAPDVLVKVCGLDFADAAFPNNHVVQTSLAKARTTIVRHDRDGVPAYHLIVGYSLAEYVWTVVFDAMGEFDGLYVSIQEN